MVYLGLEVEDRRFEGVVGGKGETELEVAALKESGHGRETDTNDQHATYGIY
jgi:hypothetical protein